MIISQHNLYDIYLLLCVYSTRPLMIISQQNLYDIYLLLCVQY